MTVAALHTRMNARFKRLERGIDAKFRAFDRRIDRRLRASVAQTNARFKTVDARFDGVDVRFDRLERQFARLAGAVERIGDKLDQNLKRLNVEVGTCLLAVNTHEKRLNDLQASQRPPEEGPPAL